MGSGMVLANQWILGGQTLLKFLWRGLRFVIEILLFSFSLSLLFFDSLFI